MKVLDFVGKIFAFLLTLLFFTVLTSLSLIIITKDLTTPKGLADYLKNIKIENLDVGDIIGKKYDKNISITDEIVSTLSKSGISEKITENVIKSDELKEKLSEIVIKYTDYLAGEENIPQITEADLKEVITNETIKESIGRDLNYAEQEAIDLFIKKATTEINNYLSTFATSKINETVKTIKKIVNEKVITILSISLAVIVVLIGICRLSVYKPLAWISIPTMLLGIIYLLSNKIKTILLKKIMQSDGAIEKIINQIINELTKKISTVGIYLLLIGLFMSVIYFVSKKISTKRKINKTNEKLIEEL